MIAWLTRLWWEWRARRDFWNQSTQASLKENRRLEATIRRMLRRRP